MTHYHVHLTPLPSASITACISELGRAAVQIREARPLVLPAEFLLMAGVRSRLSHVTVIEARANHSRRGRE